MAAAVGRALTINWGNTSPATEIGGLREKGIEMNGEPIDVTSDDDNGWRALLTVPAENQINISLSGVTKDDTLRAAFFSGDRTEQCLITFPDGGELLGTFYLASYTDTATYNDANVFEASLQSSGIVAYTPGP